MKALLICPATPNPAVANLAHTGPLATIPILGECLAGDWIEHLAARGAKHVTLVGDDRQEEMREALGDGKRWGVRIEWAPPSIDLAKRAIAAAMNAAGEPDWLPPPDNVVIMDHLPGCANRPLFESYAGWFAAIFSWMPRALTPSRVRMKEIRPGVWVGSGAHVAKSAALRAPCWIGEHVLVESGSVVGPEAVVENRSVIGRGARVTESIIGPDTLVGRLTSVSASLASGNLLINWKTGSSLRVPDPFLLSSLLQAPRFPAGNGEIEPSDAARQPPPMRVEGRGSALRVSQIPSLTEENTNEFLHTIRSALAKGREPIEIDLSQTRLIDSRGLGALFALSREQENEQSAPLRILNPTPEIQQLFELTQLNLFFGVRNSS